jgi:hypothetical protein
MALFLVRAAATQGGTARGLHTGRAAFGYHALAMGAMTWMVAAMPLLGHSIGAAGSGHHHDGAAATAAPAMTSMGAPPWWATGVTVLLAGALGVSAFVWAAGSARTPAPAPVPPQPVPPQPVPPQPVPVQMPLRPVPVRL